MKQLKSWFNENAQIFLTPNGYEQAVLARIYFPTDIYKLDDQDLEVLIKVIILLKHLTWLKRERVEIISIGYADHRGSTKYNYNLAKKRAETVNQYIMYFFREDSNFSQVTAISNGEKKAHKNTFDKNLMAENRYVDVVSSNAFELPDFPALPKPQPQILRLHYRHFTKFVARNVMADPVDKPFDEVLDLISEKLLNKLFGIDSPVPGSEDKDSRDWKFIDPNHRVNKVSISTEYTKDSGGGGTVEFWYTSIKYTWGSPQPIVTLTHTSKGDFIPKPVVITKTLTREKADKSSFIFPK